MAETGEIINKVANSPLITFDLQEYYSRGKREELDIAQWLFQGLILKEKEFRAAVKEHDWSQYKGNYIAINCSADAIVPTWAYMLVASKLEEHAAMIIFGNAIELEKILFKDALSKINSQEFKDKKVVVKGCGDIPVSEFAYVEVVRLLKPVVSSIMYGEPCSTVPIYKAPRQK